MSKPKLSLAIRARHPKVETTCKNCSKGFVTYHAWIKKGAGKYCSKACQDTYRRGRSYEDFYGQEKGLQLKQLYSSILKGSANPNYGNSKLKGDNNPNWRGGISFIPYSTAWTRRLKKTIRERDDHTCRLCGLKQEKPALDVHHIDYDKENCSDSNLISLCKQCHIKTNFNRSFWKGALCQS